MTSTERRHAKNRRLVADWTHPIGTPVVVERANGRRMKTVTESTAFLMDGLHAFIRVRGIPGNTRLVRVKARKGTNAAQETHMDDVKKPRDCRCPLRPYMGSWASGSVMETNALNRWQEEHAHHPYAKARDDLARSMQSAEGQVGSREAVFQMAKEIMGVA